jgi:hypothetical protein
MSNKREKSSNNENSGFIKLLYLIYFTGLCALLFMPSLFASASGMNFTGGEPLIKYFTLLIKQIFKSSTELAATFPELESIKWIFYVFAATIVLNLIGFLIIVFYKKDKKLKSSILNLLLISTICFSVIFLVYNYKMNVSAKLSVKTIFSLYVCLTVVFSFFTSFIYSKNIFKSLIYLLNFGILAVLLFSTFSFNGINILGVKSLYLPFFLSSNYVNLLNENLLLTVSSSLAKIIVYVFTATVIIAIINFILSTVSLTRKKLKIFDIIRLCILFILATAVLILLIVKAKTFTISKSYGLIAFVGISLVMFIFSILGKITYKSKVKVFIEANAETLSRSSDSDIGFNEATVIEKPIAETPVNIIDDNIYNSNIETEIPKNYNYGYDAEEENNTVSEINETKEVELDIPSETIEQKTIKISKPAIEDKGQQLDIESLKKEILADLYLKERTSTLVEDTSKVKPSYEIKEEPVYKPYVNPYTNNYANDKPSSNIKIPSANPYNKPAQVNHDRFFESLSNSEKEEFDNIFIKKIFGENKRLPQYTIGGDNKEFFNKVFIFIGRYRSVISENLLSKIYLYSTSI